MNSILENFQSVAQERQLALVDFTRQIIGIPSFPGQENEVAVVIHDKMVELGYDDVWVDAAGNVIGKIKGGHGPSIILNGHMDHVDPGPLEGWPYPPFSGQIVDDELWGRASVDMKGPVACMIYAASLFKQLNVTPPGDIFMTVAVMEEVGGVGTQHLVSHLNAQAAICGEPSSNTLRRGHRGRVELQVEIVGRSVHASVPHLGLNPHYMAASFLTALSSIPLGRDDALGASTVVPTLYATDQSSANVIPGHVYLTLDWRNIASESPDEIVGKIMALLDYCLAEDGFEHDFQSKVSVASQEFTTYTGLVQQLPSIFPSYILSEDNVLLQAAHAALIKALGEDRGIDVWRFATDGGHLMAAGIPTVGFGPGNSSLAHTNQERISLAQMEEALVAYVTLILALFEITEL